MSKARRWVIIVLSLAVLVMIGINMAEKDDTAQVRCAMFRNSNRRVTFRPQHGQQVLVRANITLYEPRGDYQIIVESMQPAGEGLLQQKYEQLKTKLQAEGLFDQQYKKTLPSPAHCVGVITSKTGAALHDILHVLKRRDPSLPVIIYPTAVQGDDAPGQIVRAIELANQRNECDVLIVGRGGGSIEDLWAFNEEEVARAIFACNTPVISAVGHETDVTIADYAADLRAPTPSAAAELAVFDYFQFRMDLNARKQRLMKEMGTSLERAKSRLKHDELTLRFYDPKSQLNEKKKRLADAEDTLLRLIAERQQETRRDLQNAETLLRRSMADRLAADKRNLAVKSERLWGLSPLKKISGGFGFITDGDGKRLETVEQAEAGKRITVRVKDGRIGAVVDHVEKYR